MTASAASSRTASQVWHRVQIVDVPVAKSGPKTLCYDEEWLAILRETHGMMNLRRGPTRFPTPLAAAPAVAPEPRAAVAAALDDAAGNAGAGANGAEASSSGGGGRVRGAIPPEGFTQTVDAGKRGQGESPRAVPRNPQTEAVLRLIGRPWNLSHEDAARVPGVHDFMAGAQGGDNDQSPMFDAVEINNLDPFAYSDAKEQKHGKRPKLSALLPDAGREQADAQGVASAMEVETQAQDTRPAAATAAAQHNPEEIDIGSDSGT
jgi:Lariat debranching enzyme, C-terminal domain